MRRQITPAVLAAFGLACAVLASGPSPVIARSAAPAATDECATFDLHPLRIWLDSAAVRPGDTVEIKAGSVLNHSSTIPPPPPEPVPASCLAGLRVTPAGLARVSADGARLTVSPDAPAGTLLILEARSTVGPVRLETRVVSREEAVLIGTWSQREVDCGADPAPVRPVRELRFAPGGRFSVTWTPFETYTDYWGAYVHDAATGALRLEVADANQNPPASVLAGVLQVSGDGRSVVLTEIDLGDGQHWVPERRCRYVFGRL